MKNYTILGNGCIVENAIEQNFLKIMDENGFTRVPSLKESDYMIYVTCACVGDAIFKCIDDIKNLFALSKELGYKLIITGCLTNSNLFNKLKNYENVKIINGKDWPIKVTNYILNENKRNTIKTKLENRTCNMLGNNVKTQFILEEGCINSCSFCKMNYMGKKVTSAPYKEALDYLNNMINSGTKSITLSGDNLTLYGIDLYNEQVLHNFISDLTKNDNLVNLHLGEITASNMYAELLEEICNNKKISKISLQLETASDRLLKLMNRGYDLEKYDSIIQRLKESNKFVSTILLPSFPTETYDDLDKTIKYVSEREIYTEFVSPYCDFKALPSSKLTQLSYNEKRKHAKYLKDAVLNNNDRIIKQYLGKERNHILVYKQDEFALFDSALPIWTISQKREHLNLDLGDEIITSPKRFVHKCKYNKYFVLKL